MSFQKNDKKVIRGWVMYDWANSVYSLTIATAVFPIYFIEVTKDKPLVDFLGLHIKNSALYSYSVSFAFLLVALISPLLSGIADYRDTKKDFMKFFVYLGSLSCIALGLFDGSNIYTGVFPFVFSTLAFAGSLVFYNAYLHQIVTPDRMDSVSARGFSMGYIGSVILLVINLIMIQKPELFGLSGSWPSRVSFITVGLWWAGFSQITFNALPASANKHPYSKQLILHGYKELSKVWKQLTHLKNLKLFLLSFFIYSMALQTVMYVASVFGKDEIKLETSSLIITILLIQLVAVVGAALFAYISKKSGNIASIAVALVIWVGVCIGAYSLAEGDYNGFYMLGAAVGLVMGGIQAISRSTYSKLLPETEDHASFFSFYDVTEKLAIVVGTFLWGYIDELTGGMRNGIVALVVFFIIGLAIILFVKDKKLKPVNA